MCFPMLRPPVGLALIGETPPQRRACSSLTISRSASPADSFWTALRPSCPTVPASASSAATASARPRCSSVITGELSAEGGTIALPKRARIGRLAQEAPAGPESLLDVVLAADTERASLLAAAETEHDPHRIAEMQTRLSDIAAHSAPARAAAILAGLGFSPADQARPCSEFSGGWRMRVALAAELFSQPDLLLLDEPTNYLDLEGTLWLEAHLARYPHTVIVISHDRDLLDNAVDWILHLEGGKLTLYRGGYTSFERQRARAAGAQRQARQEAGAAAAASAGFRRPLPRQGHESPPGTVPAEAARQARTDRRARCRRRAPDRNSRADANPLAADHGARRRRGRLRAWASGAAAPLAAHRQRRPHRAARRQRQRQVNPGQAVRATVSSRCRAASRGPTSSRSAISRSISSTNSTNARARTITSARLMPDAPESEVRARAGAHRLPRRMADTPTGQLSGGEKARLLLGLATIARPHLIILDEPTNHLDIDSRAALIEAINDYPGAIILISHDRHLLEACADRLWLVDNGTVTPLRRRPGRLPEAGAEQPLLAWHIQCRRQRHHGSPPVTLDRAEGGSAKTYRARATAPAHHCGRRDDRAPYSGDRPPRRHPGDAGTCLRAILQRLRPLQNPAPTRPLRSRRAETEWLELSGAYEAQIAEAPRASAS